MYKYSRKQQEYIKNMRDCHSIDRNEYLSISINEVLDDRNKYQIEDIESLEQMYLSKIIKIIQQYDFRLILIDYRIYVTDKYNPVYYLDHIELELLLGLIVSYGKEDKFFKLNDITSNGLIQEDVVILEEILRKYNVIFYLKNIEDKNDFYKDFEFFEFMSLPEIMLKFKTKNIRNEGSGSQYLEYINEILKLLSKKEKFQNKKNYSNLIEGFITLMNTPIKSKITTKNLVKLLKISAKTIFNLKRLNVFKLIHYYEKDSKRANGLINMYLSEIYKIEDLLPIFKNEEFISSITTKMNTVQINNIAMNNPLWKTPFIEFSNNLLLYSIRSLPLTYAEQYITTSLNESDKDLYYYTKTNEFMEQKVLSILSKYKNLSVFNQIKYDFQGVQYETDFLLLFNSYAIVIEVKGHHLSDSAKRGSKVKIDNHISKTVETAAKQALKIRKIIEKRRVENVFLYRNKGKILDFSNISEVVTLSISFEWLIYITTGMTLLRKKYEIPTGHVHCSLSEFDHLVDILDTEEQFITYLLKRKYLEESDINMETDELDLITYFVQYGFKFEYNLAGFAYLVSEFDRSTNKAYFMNKYTLNQDKDDKIYAQILGDTTKLTFIYSDFITKHIRYLKRNYPRHSKLLGYFQCITSNNQTIIENTVKYELTSQKVTKNRHTILTLDPYSPKLILTLSDGKPVENILLGITNELNMKKATEHGYISVIYDNLTSEFSASNITYFKGKKDKYLQQI